MRKKHLTLTLLTLTACKADEPPPPEAARQTVETFFHHLKTQDCTTLAPLLAQGGSAKPCEATVQELRAHGVELLHVLDARPDGRTPDAVLVRAQLAHRGTPRASPTLLRVERQAGAWRLRW